MILSTPTGSGKSLVATGAHFAALRRRRPQLLHRADQGAGQREVLRAVRDLRLRRVGMMTGDASVNREAKIICCTAEVLANLALREGAPPRSAWW